MGDTKEKTMTREEAYRWFLEWRGIENPCEKCDGCGSIAYGSTSTWIGGVGGQMMTAGICDVCWGSGDAENKWTDLRKLRNLKCSKCGEHV